MIENKYNGAGTMAQHTNPLAAALASHISAGSSTSCSTFKSASCKWPGKAAEDDTRSWSLYHIGELEAALGFRLQTGPVLAIMAMWGMNQCMIDPSHCFSLSL